MLILETVHFTDQGVSITPRLLSGALTLTEIDDLLDQAVDAASEPEDDRGPVFETQGQIGRRIVVGDRARLDTDLVVVSLRRAQQADYGRELAPALPALAALGDAAVTLTGWVNAGRQLDEHSLHAAGLAAAFAHPLSLVPLLYAATTIQAQQAAQLIRTSCDLPLEEHSERER
ncbi:hypothetical protein K7W42_21780 [Deinococcus sp. HMF7604]|uniref:hypothetical protein n=1 Tax=Deinococcus betulae TaxID=2873312 RepID=UPI001CCAD082|nr:hypothetical protein [Deinococcus betulae]MBZ9753468.1 hypothetical protein [Deinococcus betulae]